MSTNKTTNYNLHAWEAGDDFLRSEFNENFAKLDAGAIRMIFGSYTGLKDTNVQTAQHIELGVKPRAVIIMTQYGLNPNSAGISRGGIAGPGLTMCNAVLVTETGFSVQNRSTSSNVYLNQDGYVYYYIALI